MLDNTGEITDDLRIREIKSLNTPAEILRESSRTNTLARTISRACRALRGIVQGGDDRRAVVIDPCSIHDPEATMDNAARLAALRQRLGGDLEMVMRVYFEKPSTAVGWKGLINHPNLDVSFEIERGLRLARGPLLEINNHGLPAG